MSGPAAHELNDNPDYSLERIADALVDISIVLHDIMKRLPSPHMVIDDVAQQAPSAHAPGDGRQP